MILVHHHWNMWIGLHGGLNQIFEEAFARVFASPSARLHDDRAIGLGSRLHDGLHLLEVVHVESGDAVAMLGGMVQKLAHRDDCHEESFLEQNVGVTHKLAHYFTVARPYLPQFRSKPYFSRFFLH